jgi:hypothetical protein
MSKDIELSVVDPLLNGNTVVQYDHLPTNHRPTNNERKKDRHRNEWQRPMRQQ